ncbi:MAG: GNAT family N-acetyltransferase [Syntrophaceae bacterium]
MSSVEYINPEQDERWDRFVEAHDFGWVCHLSGWKKVLEDSFRHMKGFYPVLVEDSQILAALPVFEVNSWLTGRRLVSIPFASLCDPLVSSSVELEELFISALSLLRKLRAGRIEIRAFQSFPLIRERHVSCSKHYKTHFLVLQNPEALQKKFHRTCVRQKISRAAKSNFALRDARTESDIEHFYTLYCMTRQKLGLPSQPCAFFKNIWKTFSPSGKVQVIFAVKDEKFASALLLFRFKDRVSAEYLGWNNAFTEMSPNHFLFWEAIKAAYTDGFKIFDFGRTSPTSESLMDFKSRWGTEVAELPQLYYPAARRSEAGYANSRKYMIINKLCSKSPDFIYPMLGNFCYRHLG